MHILQQQIEIHQKNIDTHKLLFVANEYMWSGNIRLSLKTRKFFNNQSRYTRKTSSSTTAHCCQSWQQWAEAQNNKIPQQLIEIYPEQSSSCKRKQLHRKHKDEDNEAQKSTLESKNNKNNTQQIHVGRKSIEAFLLIKKFLCQYTHFTMLTAPPE